MDQEVYLASKSTFKACLTSFHRIEVDWIVIFVDNTLPNALATARYPAIRDQTKNEAKGVSSAHLFGRTSCKIAGTTPPPIQ